MRIIDCNCKRDRLRAGSFLFLGDERFFVYRWLPHGFFLGYCKVWSVAGVWISNNGAEPSLPRSDLVLGWERWRRPSFMLGVVQRPALPGGSTTRLQWDRFDTIISLRQPRGQRASPQLLRRPQAKLLLGFSRTVWVEISMFSAWVLQLHHCPRRWIWFLVDLLIWSCSYLSSHEFVYACRDVRLPPWWGVVVDTEASEWLRHHPVSA
jgi:hypothetical protein